MRVAHDDVEGVIDTFMVDTGDGVLDTAKNVQMVYSSKKVELVDTTNNVLANVAQWGRAGRHVQVLPRHKASGGSPSPMPQFRDRLQINHRVAR